MILFMQLALVLAAFAAAQLCFCALFLRNLPHPSFESVGLLGYRLRGAREHACKVLHHRWRLILAITLAIAFVTAFCSLATQAQHVATIIIRFKSDTPACY